MSDGETGTACILILEFYSKQSYIYFNKMFVNDRPIEDKKDDRLSRFNFSSYLAKSINEWKGKDSLVIALYGKWGSGKSSVINLAKEELSRSDIKNRLTVIEFNPWLFSGEEKINEHFFNEIAKELEIRNNSEKDIQLANKLRAYSTLFDLIPSETNFHKMVEKGLVLLGFFSISVGQVLQWSGLDLGKAKIILFIIGIGLLGLSFTKNAIDTVADFFEKKSITNQKTVLSFKEEIKQSLLKRDSRILVVIDDIDRLTPEEIRLIFKLIKINTDFPNIIYLLSFDRDIVQKALQLQEGINGQDYLEKIVQVNFDIPLVKQEKISKILFEELDRVLATLPKSSEALFDNTYWGNIYHSGLKDFFKNIRDVKRFSSSLEFNLSLMCREKSIEVNPIDFIAIEAIRIFAPSFYSFMRAKGDLFTSTQRNDYGSQATQNARKTELQKAIEELPVSLQEDVKNVISRIFPQIDGVFQYGYSSHGSDWIPKWNRNLRVCSPKFFDAYFTLIPGGDESELSQFEIDLILDSIKDRSNFEKRIKGFLKKGKIKNVLSRLEDYTQDQIKIPTTTYSTVIQVLFNISDDLPIDRNGMFDFGTDLQCARIIYQLLSQNQDKEDNYKIFKDAIKNSEGLWGPIYNIALETQKDEKEKDDKMMVPAEKLSELQQDCLEKIISYKGAGRLERNKNFLGILYRWKDWSKSDDWKKYVGDIIQKDDSLINFLKPFITESFSQTIGDYVGRKTKRFGYKALEDFVALAEVKQRLETIKESNKEFYQVNKEVIDMFLDYYGKSWGPLDD